MVWARKVNVILGQMLGRLVLMKIELLHLDLDLIALVLGNIEKEHFDRWFRLYALCLV
jgi:hypothetical protein